jgi:hypothetical protein
MSDNHEINGDAIWLPLRRLGAARKTDGLPLTALPDAAENERMSKRVLT